MDSATIIRTRARYANIPVKYQGLDLNSWRPYNRRSEAALASVEGFLDTWDQRCVSEPPTGSRALVGQGIAFIGTPGSGKTTLACITAAEILERYNGSIYFVAYADFIAKQIEQMSMEKLAEKGDQRALQRYWEIHELRQIAMRSKFLVIDDVGKEHHTRSGFAEDEFDRMLRLRFRNGLPTGLSSNIPFDEWGSVYNPSMESFVREAFIEVPMGGKDLRR